MEKTEKVGLSYGTGGIRAAAMAAKTLTGAGVDRGSPGYTRGRPESGPFWTTLRGAAREEGVDVERSQTARPHRRPLGLAATRRVPRPRQCSVLPPRRRTRLEPQPPGSQGQVHVFRLPGPGGVRCTRAGRP